MNTPSSQEKCATGGTRRDDVATAWRTGCRDTGSISGWRAHTALGAAYIACPDDGYLSQVPLQGFFAAVVCDLTNLGSPFDPDVPELQQERKREGKRARFHHVQNGEHRAGA